MKKLLFVTLLFTAASGNSQDLLKRIKNMVATNAESESGDCLPDIVTGEKAFDHPK